MSRLRWMLVALLVASTALFTAGVLVERSSADTHVEFTAGEPEGAHEEGGEEGGRAEDERVLGADLESTPIVVLAVAGGLGLAALAAGRVGRLRGFLAVAVIGGRLVSEHG